MSSKNSKYSDTCSKFGFAFTVSNGLDIPVCVLYQKALGNNSMKPSILTRHLEKTYRNSKTWHFHAQRNSV